jgi:hypothetical protein
LDEEDKEERLIITPTLINLLLVNFLPQVQRLR